MKNKIYFKIVLTIIFAVSFVALKSQTDSTAMPLIVIEGEDTQVNERIYNEGISLYKSQNLDEAMDKFNEVIQNDANFALAYLNRASIHSDKGNFNDAKGDLEKFISLNPKDANG